MGAGWDSEWPGRDQALTTIHAGGPGNAPTARRVRLIRLSATILGWGVAGSSTDRIYGLRRAALAPGSHVDWKEGFALHGKGQLPNEYVPTLITFSDLNDPKTARMIRPSQLGEVFGSGFSFHGAFLETTDAPIVHDIEKKLPWWSMPGRPADVAYHSWAAGAPAGCCIAPEMLFKRGD